MMVVPLCLYDGIQSLARQQCPQVKSVYCCAQQLNLVLLHSAKNIKGVKLFICNLAAFDNFLSRPVALADLLREQGFKLLHPALLPVVITILGRFK